MKNKGTVINKYTIMIPELCQINDRIEAHLTTYNRRFECYRVVCKWKIKTLDDIDLTLHMGARETGKADIHDSIDEGK